MTMIYWTNTTFLLISVIVLLRSCVSFSFCSCDICSFFLSHRLLTFQLFLGNSLCLVLHTISLLFSCFFEPFFLLFLFYGSCLFTHLPRSGNSLHKIIDGSFFFSGRICWVIKAEKYRKVSWTFIVDFFCDHFIPFYGSSLRFFGRNSKGKRTHHKFKAIC